MRLVKMKTLKVNIDTSLRGSFLCYDIYLGDKKRLSSIIFSRRGKTEKTDVCLSLIISVLLLIGFKPVPSFRKNLNIFFNGTEHIDDFNYT